MGKPYVTELANLAGTYSWSVACPVTPLVDWVKASAELPLVVVGSGGSLTTAHLVCGLHESYTGRPARPMTPLEFGASPLCLSHLAVLLVTAGGSNPDIISSYESALRREPGSLAIVCARTGSPLADLAREGHEGSLLEFDLPTGKDGFLATNTLLATAVMLARGYAQAWSHATPLPPTLADMVHPGRDAEEFRADLARRCRPLWERETLVLLHGPTGAAAGIDVESRFTEAALGHAQVADFRNFAHGRHHWLARHATSTGVLALVAREDEALAERTLSLLPEGLAGGSVPLPASGFAGALAGVVVAMHVAGLAGESRGIDPGRPSVADFGRRLYRLRPPRRTAPEALPSVEAAAIERKSGLTVANLRARGELSGWQQAYASFTASLREGRFGAVVFDYDGTLCGAADRYSGPPAAVIGHLVRLLRGGITVGVATGRGKSVRRDLRAAITDQALWDRVLVGYHNGGELGWLDEGNVPPEGSLDVALAPLAASLRDHPWLAGKVALEAKLRQITLEFTAGASPDGVWAVVERVVRSSAPQVNVVRSSHSIDILAPGVSKAALVERLVQEATGNGDVLCVGDKGRWPGNDHQLLAGRFGLSVDEVSSDPSACWNLAPPGARCVEAALYYLKRLTVRDGLASLDW